MRKLGSTEQAVMKVLWTHEEGASAREVTAGLPQSLAMTTVLTVLDRLRRKGLVRREPDGRWFRYHAVPTKAEYVSSLMLDALGSESDADAVLQHFVKAVNPDQLEALRRLMSPPQVEP